MDTEDLEDILDDDAEGLDSAELHEHLRLEVEKGQELLRIDKYLMLRKKNATRNKIQNSIDNGNILVNGKPVKSNYKVKPFDLITAVFAYKPMEVELAAEQIDITIMYEDDDIVIVNKEPGMVVHPGCGNYSGTLVNALAYHFKNLPSSLTTINENTSVQRPGLVHRIDKNTSGILVVAKTEQAMTKLAKDFYDRNLDRKYIALVWGDVKEDTGTIVGNIARDKTNRKVFSVPADPEEGKHAVTHYKVLERFGYVTLVECKLETGRTHQIRVHMRYIGHPLFSDHEYGGNRILKGTTFTKYKQFVDNCFAICPRQALHAKSLGITHPTTGEYKFFDSEIAPDMLACIDKWRKYAQFNIMEDVDDEVKEKAEQYKKKHKIK